MGLFMLTEGAEMIRDPAARQLAQSIIEAIAPKMKQHEIIEAVSKVIIVAVKNDELNQEIEATERTQKETA
jgi:hypothetical protein